MVGKACTVCGQEMPDAACGVCSKCFMEIKRVLDTNAKLPAN